ncbi:MAG: hypothetical protein AB1665_05240 [Candidatus Thermoplasmatota archaeon]
MRARRKVTQTSSGDWKAKGDPAKALEYLEKALAEFERVGMKLWAEKCKKALEGL